MSSGFDSDLDDLERRLDRDGEREPDHFRAHLRRYGRPTATQVSSMAATLGGCIAYHAAAKRWPAVWAELIPVKGRMPGPTEGTELELANCPRCKSTIAREVPAFDLGGES